MRRSGYAAGILAGIWGAVVPWPASAELRLCNQGFDVLNIAIAQPSQERLRRDPPDGGTDDGFTTRGWWRVAPGQCATLLRGRLESRYFYLFAADVFGRESLSGSVPLCVAPRGFAIETQGDCLLRGYLDARFIEVDTEERDDWTVFVAPRDGWADAQG